MELFKNEKENKIREEAFKAGLSYCIMITRLTLEFLSYSKEEIDTLFKTMKLIGDGYADKLKKEGEGNG